jgi:hypothetical protein
MGILLSVVAGFFKILVALNGGADVEGELGVDNMVNGISKRGEAVKDDDLVILERGASVVTVAVSPALLRCASNPNRYNACAHGLRPGLDTGSSSSWAPRPFLRRG